MLINEPKSSKLEFYISYMAYILTYILDLSTYNVFHHRAAQPIELPKICQALTIYSISFMPQPPNALLLEYKGRLQLAL